MQPIVMPAVNAFNTLSIRASRSTGFRLPPWSGSRPAVARAYRVAAMGSIPRGGWWGWGSAGTFSPGPRPRGIGPLFAAQSHWIPPRALPLDPFILAGFARRSDRDVSRSVSAFLGTHRWTDFKRASPFDGGGSACWAES